MRHRLRVDDDDLTVTLGRSLQVVTGKLMTRPIKNGRFPSYTRSICEMVHEAAISEQSIDHSFAFNYAVII